MTAKELYHTLICKPDLHSMPKVFDNTLVWHLYQNAYIQVTCHSTDASVQIMDGRTKPVVRWQLREDELAAQLYKLGQKGNLLILKKTLTGTEILYLGPAENTPLPHRKSFYWGPGPLNYGSLLYFDQKEKELSI